jgi:hypothetical protein
MAKFLNNPRVVLPLALASALFIVYRVAPGVFEFGPSTTPRASAISLKASPRELGAAAAEAPAVARVGLMLRERWLPNRWRQFATMRRDPFIVVEAAPPAPVDALAEDPIVVIDPGLLDSYFAEHLGLDERGFFVRFGSIRKREGDSLRTTEGRDLVVGSIAIAEIRRTPEEYVLAVREKVAELSLLAVMRLDSDNEAALDGPPVTVDPGFGEGDSLDLNAVERMRGSLQDSSAVINGGRRPGGLYAQGDLIVVNPSIGLGRVEEAAVVLVDRNGELYHLSLD